MAEEEVLVLDGDDDNTGDSGSLEPGPADDVPDSGGDDTNDGDPSGDSGGDESGGDADDVSGDGDDDTGDDDEDNSDDVGDGPPEDHSEGPLTNLPPNAASQAKMVAGSNALEARKKAERAKRLGLG